ncbi:carbohydrate sulfotransferase 10-like isoform X2 [Littorina saxatilis]
MLEVCRHGNVSIITSDAASRFIFPTATSPTVLYCPVPAVASMYLRKLIAAANHLREAVNWKDRFHVRDVSEGYDKAVMFLFAREPYSRIFAAYVSKLWVPNQEFWRAAGGPIIGTVREDPPISDLACGHDVTFAELVRYVIVNAERGKRVHGIFTPVYQRCEVCHYNYDYIGHMETFSEDAAYILDTINVRVPADFEGLEDRDHAIVEDYVFQTYVTLAGDKGKCVDKYRLLLRVWRALQIRGSIIFSMRFPLPWKETFKLKRYELEILLTDAIQKSADVFAVQARKFDESERLSRRDLVTRSRVLQRKMALASAWSTVPMADRVKVRYLFDNEFKMFGYDPFLEEVFSQKVRVDIDIFDLATV